eukprot:5144884-Karenia_brevis.AAC.1
MRPYRGGHHGCPAIVSMNTTAERADFEMGSAFAHPFRRARRMSSGSVWRRCHRQDAQGGPAARRDQLQGGHLSVREG